MAYGTVYEDLWRRAAGYVDNLLRGPRLGDLLVEQAATKFDLKNLEGARVDRPHIAAGAGWKRPSSLLGRQGLEP
jgi:hypothetical protein